MTEIVLAVTINDANSVFPDKRKSAVPITILNRHTASRGIEGTGLFITPSVRSHPAFKEMLHAVIPCFVISGRDDVLGYISSELES